MFIHYMMLSLLLPIMGWAIPPMIQQGPMLQFVDPNVCNEGVAEDVCPDGSFIVEASDSCGIAFWNRSISSDGNPWVLGQVIPLPNCNIQSIALAKGNCSTVVVGCTYGSDNSGFVLVLDNLIGSGGWTQTAQLTYPNCPSPNAYCLLGLAVGIDDPRQTIMATIPEYQLQKGGVLIYHAEGIGSWTTPVLLQATDYVSPAAQQGRTAVLSRNGQVVIWGAQFDANNNGSIWYSHYTAPLWSLPSPRYSPPDLGPTVRDPIYGAIPPQFGSAITTTYNGSIVAVSSYTEVYVYAHTSFFTGRVRTFQIDTSAGVGVGITYLQNLPLPSDMYLASGGGNRNQFGQAMTISSYGTVLAIAAEEATNTGLAGVWRYAGMPFAQVGTAIFGNPEDSNSNFGCTITFGNATNLMSVTACYSDGGVSGTGATYVFTNA